MHMDLFCMGQLIEWSVIQEQEIELKNSLLYQAREPGSNAEQIEAVNLKQEENA